MKHSRFKRLKPVYLPPFTGTRVLMLPFRMEDIETLPNDLAHYKQTVQELIAISPPTDDIKTRLVGPPNLHPERKGVAYLTIDEKRVGKGQTLRTRGLHIDGAGNEAGKTDLGPWATAGLKGFISSYWNQDRWMQSAAGIGGMITVSSPSGCRAWYKDFEGIIGFNGSCEKLRNLFPEEEATVFEAGVAYWCNWCCVHESLPMEEETERIFVRLSMPSDAPWYEGYTRNPKGVEPTGIIVPRHVGRVPGGDRVGEPEVILNG